MDPLKHDWGKSREFSERLETLFVDSVLLMLEESKQTDFDSWDVSAWMCESVKVRLSVFVWSELQLTAIDWALSFLSPWKWHIAILQSHGFSGADWHSVNVMVVQPLLRDKKREVFVAPPPRSCDRCERPIRNKQHLHAMPLQLWAPGSIVYSHYLKSFYRQINVTIIALICSLPGLVLKVPYIQTDNNLVTTRDDVTLSVSL